MFEALLFRLAHLSLGAVCLGCLLENGLVLALALTAGEVVTRAFSHRRIAPPPPPLERRELALAAAAVLGNTAVTVLGWELWRLGVIRFGEVVSWRTPVDVGVLLLLMDGAMYFLHRLVHHPTLFPWVHSTHHRYPNPRPLTLFVLSPLEVAGFGGLWLGVLMIYPPTWAGMSIYLALNVVFGTIGHVGVQPFPDAWLQNPAFGWLAGSAFHAGHHREESHNFGFYTQVWDRLLGTLGPKRGMQE